MTIKPELSEVSDQERLWKTLHRRSRRAASARGSRDSHSHYERSPPVPTVSDHIATPMRHRRKNHVQENILYVMRSKPVEQHDQRIVDSVNGSSQSILNSGLVSTYSRKKSFGKIPAYIRKNAKEQRERMNAMEMEAQRRMEREANCYLSLDHRSSILQGLQKNWSIHQHQFLGLSLFGDTPHEKKRQNLIQSHLMELERYIDILKSFPTISILD